MTERARLVALHAEGLYSTAELATRFGVSRKTAYKWLARYRDGGLDALDDQPRVRHGQHAKTPPEVEALVVEARRKHPTWGPRKLVPWIARRHPSVKLPAASTVGAILKRHGLVTAAATAARGRAPRQPPARGRRTGRRLDGRLQGPVQDRRRRLLLPAHGLRRALALHPRLRRPRLGRAVRCAGAFDRLFREHGLPRSIRTDNGVPFATQAICGLSRL